MRSLTRDRQAGFEPDVAEAEALFRKTLEEQTRTLGAENSDTLATQTGIARVLAGEVRYGEAESLAKKTLTAQLRVLGPQNADPQSTLQFLGKTLVREGKYAEASKLYEETIDQLQKTPGADSSGVWYSYAALAAAANERGIALEHLRTAIEHGYKDMSRLLADNDFKSLHGDPRFEALVGGERKRD